MTERRHPDAICEDCTLCSPINAFVPSTGPGDARLAVVGEGPGHQEGRTKIPFSGPSGKLLDAVLHQNGIDRRSVYLTNAVLCRPPDNRTPTKEEVAACLPRLQKELQALPLDKVIALGNTAAQALIDTDVGITALRVGAAKKSPWLDEVDVIPTFHPAACLRAGDYFPSMALDFSKAVREMPEWKPPIYKVFDDEHSAVLALREMLDRSDVKEIVVDIEVGIEKDTDFDHPERYQFLCVGIGYASQKVIVIGEEALKFDDVINWLGHVMHEKDVWCHNGKFDLAGMTGLGIFDVRLAGDTMLASYVLDERAGTHALGYLSEEYLGTPNWKHDLDQYVGSGKKKASYALVPRPILYQYNAWDLSCTWDLKEFYKKELPRVSPKFTQLHRDLCDISPMIQHIETQGLCVDQEYFDKLTVDYQLELDKQEQFLSTWVDNPRSPLQVKRALLNMGIRTESTDDLHLEIILRKIDWRSEAGSFVHSMRRYRKDQKMYGTYIKGMGQAIYQGRLHGNFLLHGTTSGRWACKKPNLLNIPRGRIIKDGIVPDPGCVFVQGDLKTAELRVVGIEADCPYLIEVLSDPDRDIHGEVATQRYGPGWTKDQRVRAKAVVFGLGYGREAESIAIEYDMPIEEAKEVIEAFFSLIPEVKKWQQHIKGQVFKGVDLENAFGRQRRFHLITKQNQANVGREALSFIPQSTANDINMRAATRLWKMGVDVRLCVHDSVLAVAKPEDAEEIAQLIRDVHMETALLYSDRIPFYSDTSIGNSWGALT